MKNKISKSRPLNSEIIENLQDVLSINGKKTLQDWHFLLVGIGGGLFTENWNDTITLSQLYDILTHGVPQEEFDRVIESIERVATL